MYNAFMIAFNVLMFCETEIQKNNINHKEQVTAKKLAFMKNLCFLKFNLEKINNKAETNRTIAEVCKIINNSEFEFDPTKTYAFSSYFQNSYKAALILELQNMEFVLPQEAEFFAVKNKFQTDIMIIPRKIGEKIFGITDKMNKEKVKFIYKDNYKEQELSFELKKIKFTKKELDFLKTNLSIENPLWNLLILYYLIENCDYSLVIYDKNNNPFPEKEALEMLEEFFMMLSFMFLLKKIF